MELLFRCKTYSISSENYIRVLEQNTTQRVPDGVVFQPNSENTRVFLTKINFEMNPSDVTVEVEVFLREGEHLLSICEQIVDDTN